MKRNFVLVLVVVLLSLVVFVARPTTRFVNSVAFADAMPLIEGYLETGNFAEGKQTLAARLKLRPDEDQTRFGLATIQLMDGVETLMQSLYRYGLRSDNFVSFLPIVRLPVPRNYAPEVLTYKASRQVLQTFLDDLAEVEQTLAKIKDDSVKLPLRFGQIRLDFNADGTAEPEESFTNVFAAVTRAEIPEEAAADFVITFDRGDAAWLQAYTHLLSALVEFLLAHDTQELFNAGAHVFFLKVDSPYDFLAVDREFGGFADYIALLHLMRFEPTEPQRMAKVRQHLLATTQLSRQSWQLIQAETDNENEWLPNPNQTGILPDAEVTQEMIDAWVSFLAESEQLLDGKKLIPFWRGDDGRGINLKRLFLEPSTMDLVLWVQGTAAAPFLEPGDLTEADVWRQLNNVFGRQMFGFAVWFN